MQIAYLILAYNNFDHLRRLINALDTPECKFYIHIDKRSQMPDIKSDNIFFIGRINSYWSTFNCVRATIRLLRMAIKDDNDYFVLISGSDYPIVSNDEIQKRFQRRGEFMWLQKYNRQTPISYYKYFYFICERRSSSFKTRFYNRIERILRRLKIKKRILPNLYVGSTWFALTRDCVKYVLHDIDHNKKWVKFFKYSRFPEESFFVTIVGNSPFKEKIIQHINYTDWNEKNQLEIIRKEHIPIMKRSEFLFARKFNDDSIEVINLIDKELRGISDIIKYA